MGDRSEHLNLIDLVQSVVLIVLEALLTFLLKSDLQSKKLAQHLIQQQALVEVRTHLPEMVFFITFTQRGVLLDAKKPERQIDAVVMASFMDLVHAFFTAPASSLKKINIDGAVELIDELRVLMNSFNLQQIINHWLQSDWFKSLLLGAKEINEDGESVSKSGRASSKQRALLKKINEQQLLVDQLSIQAKEQSYVIARLHRRMRIYMITGLVFVACLILALIASLIYLWV
jgi:hypothetical protein